MNIGGPGGGTPEWIAFFNANPGMQGSAFNAVLEASMNVDEMYGTSITEDALANFTAGAYTPY